MWLIEDDTGSADWGWFEYQKITGYHSEAFTQLKPCQSKEHIVNFNDYQIYQHLVGLMSVSWIIMSKSTCNSVFIASVAWWWMKSVFMWSLSCSYAWFWCYPCSGSFFSTYERQSEVTDLWMDANVHYIFPSKPSIHHHLISLSWGPRCLCLSLYWHRPLFEWSIALYIIYSPTGADGRTLAPGITCMLVIHCPGLEGWAIYWRTVVKPVRPVAHWSFV